MAKKTLADLQVLMGRMGEAYFFNTCPTLSSAAAAENIIENCDYEMPISEDGVTFEFGAPEITAEKITEGRAWYTFASKGDDNIAMQVPSLHVDLNDLFYTAKGNTTFKAKLGNDTFEGKAYSTKVKKVTGAWLFCDPEHTCFILLPKTDNYANLVGATGDAKGYYNVAVSTLEHAEYGDIVIFQKVAA